MLCLAGPTHPSDSTADIRVSRQNFEDAFRTVRPSVSKKVRNTPVCVRSVTPLRSCSGLWKHFMYLPHFPQLNLRFFQLFQLLIYYFNYSFIITFYLDCYEDGQEEMNVSTGTSVMNLVSDYCCRAGLTRLTLNTAASTHCRHTNRGQ